MNTLKARRYFIYCNWNKKGLVNCWNWLLFIS